MEQGRAPWAGPGSMLNTDGTGIEATVVYDRRSADPTRGTNGVTIVPGVSKVLDAVRSRCLPIRVSAPAPEFLGSRGGQSTCGRAAPGLGLFRSSRRCRSL